MSPLRSPSAETQPGAAARLMRALRTRLAFFGVRPGLEPPSHAKVTLALGGGGARGVAHLGAVEAIREHGIEIERIVGVSIGSLAGAMCAFDLDIHAVQKKALDYLMSPEFQAHQQVLFGTHPRGDETATGGIFTWYQRVKQYLRANQLFHRVIRTPSLLPGLILKDVVDHLLPDADIADAKIPLAIVTVDLRSGHQVVLENGPLRDAVRASSSLPGIFPPIEIGEMNLCDIGVFYSLPTTIARSYDPRFVIAVDVSSEMRCLDKCETALDVLMRMDEIGEALFRKHVRHLADLVIRPDVAGVEWFDFSTCDKLVEAGRAAGRRALAHLKDRG
ncbi:MAG: patatin-like phospholipase family protein [Planctomycetaceae bacterium]